MEKSLRQVWEKWKVVFYIPSYGTVQTPIDTFGSPDWI